jgi:phenylacetate-CoA ligase
MGVVCIKVEARADRTQDDYHAPGLLLESFGKEIIGINARTTVRGPGSLPKSAGEAARVTDLRKNQGEPR